MQRKRVLLLSDDCRLPSGVGIQSYKLLKGLQKTGEFDLVQIAGSLIQQNPQPVNFEGLKLWPVGNGYGDANTLRAVIQQEKPDITILFSDPRFFTWAFMMDNEIRQYTKLIFYSTWDQAPFPNFNLSWYAACDKIVMLSNFSYNLIKGGGVDCEYAPHGGDPSEFYKLDKQEVEEVKKVMFQTLPNQPEFVVLYNNRNIIRKRTTDIIIAFRRFWQTHKNSLMIMNTEPIDRDGNDLLSVMKYVEPNDAPIIINRSKLPFVELNKLYNVADVTIGASINEGFGLSCMESLLAETPNITVRTGGLTEQMTDGVNTFGILLDAPVKTCYGVLGSPYIFQDYVSIDQLVNAMSTAYDMKKAGTWQQLGTLGREHIIKNYHINSTVEKWVKILKDVYDTPSKHMLYTVKTI